MNDDNYELFTMKEWAEAFRIGLIALGAVLLLTFVITTVGWLGETIVEVFNARNP